MDAKKILIAEDNPGLARVLSFKFKSCGFAPTMCADGKLAWEAFQQDDFLAIVSDQEMPHMTGVELLTNVRGVDPHIPVFLVTGRQLELQQAPEVESLSVTKIFAKPFSPGNVVTAVEAAIVKRQATQSSAASPAVDAPAATQPMATPSVATQSAATQGEASV